MMYYNINCGKKRNSERVEYERDLNPAYFLGSYINGITEESKKHCGVTPRPAYYMCRDTRFHCLLLSDVEQFDIRVSSI